MAMPEKKSFSPILSNLAKASEKQQRYAEADLFSQLAAKFHEPGDGQSRLQDLRDHLASDLAEYYPVLQTAGEEAADRGVLRALKWGQKVTTLQKTLIDRYLEKGAALLEGNDLFVCEACGFIFLGSETPDICPVCKAPRGRFSIMK